MRSGYTRSSISTGWMGISCASSAPGLKHRLVRNKNVFLFIHSTDDDGFAGFGLTVGPCQVEIDTRGDHFAIAVRQVPDVLVDPLVIGRAVRVQRDLILTHFPHQVAAQGVDIE